MSLREEMDKVYEQYGKLRPPLVIAYAREHEDSELHQRLFVDLNDEKAAETGRLYAARQLIRSVRVTYRRPKDKGGDRSVRYWQPVRRDDSGQEYDFEPVEKVAADPVAKEIVRRELERDWQQLKKRAEEFALYADFMAMVNADLEAA